MFPIPRNNVMLPLLPQPQTLLQLLPIFHLEGDEYVVGSHWINLNRCTSYSKQGKHRALQVNERFAEWIEIWNPEEYPVARNNKNMLTAIHVGTEGRTDEKRELPQELIKWCITIGDIQSHQSWC